jgi:AcrR family transcriptional regulator
LVPSKQAISTQPMTSTATQVSRQKLLEAAMRVFAESGLRGATTRRIAEAAGVNEVTLFRQFKSKTALINEVAELYAQKRSEEALPSGPVSPLRELSEWCDAHLAILRDSRNMIRKCMAEIHELPHMADSMRAGPVVVHRQLRDYTTSLVKLRGLPLSREEISTTCVMLQGALFGDAMGRDIMPDLYPPVRRAGTGYARMFLRMIGAHEDAGDVPVDEKAGEHPHGGRAAEVVTPRNGQRQRRSRRGT